MLISVVACGLMTKMRIQHMDKTFHCVQIKNHKANNHQWMHYAQKALLTDTLSDFHFSVSDQQITKKLYS